MSLHGQDQDVDRMKNLLKRVKKTDNKSTGLTFVKYSLLKLMYFINNE